KELYMAKQSISLKDALSHASEIHISVTGRKSGKTISNPVWFAADESKLYLLPVKGSDTQWYKNVLKNPSMTVKAGGTEAELKGTPITDAKQVVPVVEKFKHKYGAGDVKKYYSKLDVAVVAPIS
ncbi:MAG: nitroreductase/quinone reductase family protein, partial [Candidatus Dormibacteraceae bacterium]